MTFHLHRAERADALADALAEILASAPADPFQAEVVAVHSRGSERWLSHHLSHRLGVGVDSAAPDGVCANLSFPFPDTLVDDALAVATGVPADDDPWRPARLAWPLLEALEAGADAPTLAVVARHVGLDGDADALAVARRRRRRWSTARHVADLFDRYAVHRPAMVLDWLDGRDVDASGSAIDHRARWQPHLYRLVAAAVPVASPASRLAAGCEALRSDPALTDLPARVAVFGVTRLPRAHLMVLHALAEHRDVHVMVLHPSPATWRGRRDDGHRLLRSWGADADGVRQVLAGVAPGGVDDVHHAVDGTGARTLLGRLQEAIRTDTAPTEKGPSDGSIQIHKAHGRARQVEIVRDAIAHLMAADPTLEPRDIVVMCPDIEEIAPLVQATFGVGETPPVPGVQPRIPFRLTDRALRQTNPTLGAMADVLDLAGSRLTVTAVLDFAGLEPVRRRFGFGDDDRERLHRWAAATGVHWGLDADHRARAGTAPIADGTWRSGLDRLLAGVAVGARGVELVGAALPLDHVSSGDIDTAGRFAELVDRLAWVTDVLEADKTLSAWVEALSGVADALFDSRGSSGRQRAQLDRLLAEVASEGAGSSTALTRAEVIDLLSDRLRGQPSRAAFRTGEITVCTLVPMRAIPHRVVCVVGLDDGAFPRQGVDDGDDLLAADPQPGDHDRRSEDRQLLLDALMAATEAFVVTYTGRDVTTNEPRPPAVPVTELIDAVAALTDDPIVTEHPLHADDVRSFQSDAAGRPWGFDERARLAALAGARQRTATPFAPTPLDPLPPADLTLDELARAIGNPIQTFLRQRLGLSLREWDDPLVDRLPLAVDGLGQWAVGDRLLRLVERGHPLAEAVAAEGAAGLVPPGALGRRAIEQAASQVERIAAAGDQARAGAPVEWVDVDLEVGERRLTGRVPVHGSRLVTSQFGRLKATHRIARWIDLLAVTLAHPDTDWSSTTVFRDRGEAERWDLLAPPSTTSDAHLRDLVDLYDLLLTEPLPLWPATSFAYARARGHGQGAVSAAVAQAGRAWESGQFDREDAEAEHVLVNGGKPVVDVLFAADGAERPDHEPSRAGHLARRLWDPILAAQA